MKEIIFEELGYFTLSECQRIKEKAQGKTYMNFDIRWHGIAGNNILIVRTDYNESEAYIKNFFLKWMLSW